MEEKRETVVSTGRYKSAHAHVPRFDASLTQFLARSQLQGGSPVASGVVGGRTVSTAIHRRFWSNATIRGLVSCNRCHADNHDTLAL